METSSRIGIFLLMIYVFGSVNCRSMPPVRHYTLDRLNIKRAELKQMCDAKGENFYDDIHNKHISFTLNLTEKFMTWKKEVSPTDDVYKLVQERCNKDMLLKEMLKKFIESSQLCAEEKDRLKGDKLQALTSRLMELFCAQYTHSHAFSSDEGCLDLVTNAAIDTCKEKYKTVQFIPLPFIYNNKECNDYQKYSECRFDAMKSCKDATKTAVEAADSIMFHTFYGCQNISVIPEKITIKRSLVDNDDFIRFNINAAEYKEKCNRNANMSFENIQKSHTSNLVQIMKEQSAMLMKIKLLGISDAAQQDAMIQESFSINPTVKGALENMYELVELCLPENERFSSEKKAKIFEESINEICSTVKYGVRTLASGKGCFQDLNMFIKIASCDTRDRVENILYFIPLPFTPTAEDCSLILKVHECELNTVKGCENWTKISIQSRLDEANKFLGCHNR
ncbi:uncharacterized protein LOC127288953 [Leptopilina boulardi]|uniref:uncharacterized protein LOC127288953 n=1 Tax=Leptopilina boulardi TaxID=63433 RepID=UPI0021F5ADBE|nr:uncharacterized protein LOC127288953 [Leptopilina boulardi]